jgi:hypothetical protein
MKASWSGLLRVSCPAMCLKWSAKAWRNAPCAECHVLRDVLIASKLASTGFSLILVGAGLAMVVNDHAYYPGKNAAHASPSSECRPEPVRDDVGPDLIIISLPDTPSFTRTR